MKNLRFVNFALISTLSLITLTSCKKKTVEYSILKTAKVRVLEVDKTSSNIPQEYIGSVESSNTTDVSFITTGSINRMNCSEGQNVSKGQLMASLNTTTLQNTHSASVFALKQAQDAYNRLNNMYQSQSLPEIKLIDIKTKLEEAKATEIITRKALSDSYLYAPVSGVISKKYFENGMNVTLGVPVYTIMNLNSVKIKIPIPEGEISQVQRGDFVDIKVSALDNKTYRGQVIEKGVAANPISHTYDINVKIDNPNARLMPGMVVKAYLNSNSQENFQNFFIPIQYVLVDYPDKRYVWVVDKNNIAQRKEVTLGILSGNNVEIISGINSKDRIITNGFQNISIGSKVEIIK